MSQEQDSQPTSYQCPICGNQLPVQVPIPRYDAPCSGCGHRVWCRLRLPSQDLLLEVLPERVPEPWEVEKLVQAIEQKGTDAPVIMDLSRLDLIDSSMVARFVSMNRRIHSFGGRFVLSGLCPIVREIFDHLRLDKAFEIEDAASPGTAVD